MPLPTFTTGRLVVRQLALIDVDAIAAMDADPEVTRFTGGPETGSAHREDLEGWVDDEGDPFGLGMWVVTPQQAPERFLGWVMLWPLVGWEPEVEIGWRFARNVWGQGYAPEAARPVMDHGFAAVGLDTIVAVLDPDNHRSRRVCEKLGMTARGTRRAYGVDNAFYMKDRLNGP